MSLRNFKSKYNLTFLFEKSWARFAMLWLLMFTLYLPAAKAGFVADFSGWLASVRNLSFWNYLNRKGFLGQSLYQFTQFNTWVFYQLFGVNAWLWHLLFVTLHAINCMLLYKVAKKVMDLASVSRSEAIALTGILLFSISPYLSETIAWEPSFHFLQGLLLILLVLQMTFAYYETGNRRAMIGALAIYFLSTFSLEIFYVTPWLVGALAVYMWLCNPGDRRPLKIAIGFVAPMLAVFALHLWLLKLMFGGWVAHIGTATVTGLKYTAFGKPLKYLFHLLFLGRFFSPAIRDHVYDACSHPVSVSLFLLTVVTLFIVWIKRFSKLSGRLRAAGLMFAWLCIGLAILVPLWFQELQLVIYDRYLYFAGSWFYLLFALLISGLTVAYMRTGLLVVFALVNLRFTILVNRYWGKSARVIDGLFTRLPDSGGKPYLLLNIPQNMNGVAMIGAEKESEFQLLHDLLYPDKKIKTTVYDGMAYNMLTPRDGAHVRVVNDTTMRVTLNQWGGWWWFAGMGGTDYENAAYRIKQNDQGTTGCSYDLYLRKPADSFLILFSTGDNWKVVNTSNHDYDQY